MFRDRLPGCFFARVRPLQRLVLILLSVCWVAAAEAQMTPRLVIERPAEQPARLSAAKVDVHIVGSVAVSTVELTIHNPNSRVLEGALEFPLLDGQSVIGFASEVNGALRDAVAIEKAKGRQVFDDVVRNQIDPALLEKTSGNNYKLRVYPIRAQGYTRLQIRLMETLRPHDGGLLFRLPLGFASGLAKLDLTLRVADPGAAPKLTTQGLGTVVLKPAGRFYELSVERQQIGKEALLTLQLPESAEPRVVTQRQGEATYFYAELPVKPLAAPRPPPKKLALVWDASASGLNRRRADEITLLRRYLEQLGEVEVNLHVLRDALDAPQRFVVKGGDSSALRAELDRLPYDGGTNLALLAAIPKADVMLLFSDGIDNFGEG
ncbi:MAG TPA: VIT domain-containing protein, partial [Rhodocyclaceae bacterium]|nr:VIT domain-containing protein [Rhodocyclaceae bacterium]